MSTYSAPMHEWYRFLDAHSDDEAVSELRRAVGRLDAVYDELVKSSRPLVFAPDGDLVDTLMMSRSTLSEVIEMLSELVSRFRAGEHQIA